MPNGPGVPEKLQRRIPVGAEVQTAGGVHFRVWAPASKRVAVALAEREDLAGATEIGLTAEADGYWSGLVAEARVGMHYRYRLERGAYPDPASRFQPDGPHGASQIVDPGAFAWTDAEWRGVSREGQVIYEMHIGTFTPEGTWAAAMAQLPQLAELGVTLLEVMPVADFPGRFGWGYDGVNLVRADAALRRAGRLPPFRRSRARARPRRHPRCGLQSPRPGRKLSLRQFAPHYFSERYKNEWGDALNFDDEHSAPVREFFIANAGYWIEEFHCDGLRLDATQQIFDAVAGAYPGRHRRSGCARRRAGAALIIVGGK